MEPHHCPAVTLSFRGPSVSLLLDGHSVSFSLLNPLFPIPPSLSTDDLSSYFTERMNAVGKDLAEVPAGVGTHLPALLPSPCNCGWAGPASALEQPSHLGSCSHPFSPTQGHCHRNFHHSFLHYSFLFPLFILFLYYGDHSHQDDLDTILKGRHLERFGGYVIGTKKEVIAESGVGRLLIVWWNFGLSGWSIIEIPLGSKEGDSCHQDKPLAYLVLCYLVVL